MPEKPSGKSISRKLNVLARCGICAAILIVLGQFSIPLPQIPITLQTFAVTLCAALLSPAEALLTVLTYVFLGACGIPVFAGFTGGIGILFGPTGGFLIGFLPAAYLMSFSLHRGNRVVPVENKWKNMMWLLISLALFNITTYTTGLIWFMISTGTGLVPSISVCVLPFLPGGVIKSIAFIALYPVLIKIHPVIYKISRRETAV